MTPQTKKIIIWSSVAVVLGVGGYFAYDYFKKKRDAKAEEEKKKREEEEAKNNPPETTPTLVPVNPSSVNVPANLNLILQRLGKRASLQKFLKNSFVVVCDWNKGDRKYTFFFYDNDVYKVFNEGSYLIFDGKYTDAGRGLSVRKDNYSKTSKVGSAFTTDSFWKTGAKLFTDRK